MAHSHLHTSEPETPETRAMQRRAMRVMVLIVVPLAIWTLGALIVMWPGDVSDHINSEAGGFAIAGSSMPSGTIVGIEEISCEGMQGWSPGTETTCANIQVRVDEGPEEGQVTEVVMNSAQYSSGVSEGTRVKLYRTPMPDGPGIYQFADFERSTPLIVFLLVFAVAVVAIARFRGFMGLVGLGFAAVIISKFMFPALIAGGDPVWVGLVGSSAIMFVVLYTAHGFSARTTTALLGTLFGLGVSAGLGLIATKWAHLSGVAAEDDYLLAATAPDLMLTSVVICGIIVAGLGVLNDVTITQASAVWELSNSGQRDSRKLYNSAMRIGRDHIASTVYTIAFATAGASLSTLLLIALYDRPIWEVLQLEEFSAEIIRTVVGSIGLVLSMPLTTAIGVIAVRFAGSRRAAATSPASPSELEADDFEDDDQAEDDARQR